MKKYCITLSTVYGSVTIDDISAKSKKEAFEIACNKLIDEVKNYAETEEIVEYN